MFNTNLTLKTLSQRPSLLEYELHTTWQDENRRVIEFIIKGDFEDPEVVVFLQGGTEGIFFWSNNCDTFNKTWKRKTDDGVIGPTDSPAMWKEEYWNLCDQLIELRKSFMGDMNCDMP